MASTDRAALVALYNATDGASWKKTTNWNTTAPLSQWHGVEANNAGRVVKLILDNNNLRGPIPLELGNLTALKELGLSRNQLLTGAIPAQLGALTKLTWLSLSSNKLDGPIPPELGKLAALERFDLSLNQLSGPIPEELGKLTTLKELCLNGNKLSGHIPPQIGDLSSLEVLHLSWNKLDGAIPAHLGALTKLTWLSLSRNKLDGPIPSELGNLSALKKLFLRNNQLSGPSPEELGKLTVLQELYLSGNNLSGHIPPELGALSELRQLTLFDNKLTGPIPPELGNLTALKELGLTRNQLTEVPAEVLELCRARLQQPSWGSNPWSRPPSTVLASGFESALGWWEDVERFGVGKSNKLKLVLVGLAKAGKTTIVRHFTGGSVPTPPDRTVGIEITPDWRPVDEGRLQVSVWDFAGQEDYYSSHQLFLTKGALFLLVVDLRTFYDEVRQSGVDNFNDRHGRIYWWLEMLHMRVPGAALALVGSHVDQMEEEDADEAGACLRTVVSKFIEDKAKNASTRQSSRRITVDDTTTIDTDHPRDAFSSVDPSGSRGISAKPLILHSDVFKVSLARTSVTELRRWIVKAASGQECPPGFNFPAVDQTVPKAWVEAYNAMDVLRGTTPCVLWSEAVREFIERMGGNLPDGGEVLLRAMQHREAEGGVLLSLANPSNPVGSDMLHLDPAWLIELVRRLTDHNLVDNNREKQDGIKGQLREYARENDDDFARLWDTHKAYLKSGYLDKAYLRFLWIHRKIQGAQTLRESLQHLVADEAFGYPGLKCFMSFEDPAEVKSTLLRDLRAFLDNRDEFGKTVDRFGKTVDRLEVTASKLSGVANQLVQQELLAANAERKKYPYPRLVILVPDGEAYGNNERIQRVGWDRWRKAWESLSLPDVGLHHKFRLRFLCEHSLEEVPCGPDGLGYPIEQLKDWVKRCVPLMKASLWILRVAVGTVSNVDLPLNEVLEAAVKATGAAMLEGVGTEVPNSVDNDPIPVFGEGATVEQKRGFRDMQGSAYEFLCDFVQEAESSTPRRFASKAYYAAGSYQQGSNAAVVASSDQAYAERLQQQEFGNAQQALPTATGQPVRPGAAGTQYIYPQPTPFDPASLGVAGGFIAPHEARLLDAFALGKTVRLLAILDGLILVLSCAYFPSVLLLVWGPVSGWMAGTTFSTAWTYAYCCYYVLRLTANLAYIFEGYLLFILVFALNLFIARYLLRFAKLGV
eukprot:g11847.t1